MTDSTEIRYKRTDYLDGPTYTILRSQVYVIKRADGTTDTVKELQTASNKMTDPYQAGVMDAKKYYDSYKGAGAGTLVVSLLSPLAGLIPAIACSSTPPRKHNLDYPDSELMKNTEYARGYQRQAKKTKQGRVWKNWAIGFGVNLVLGVLVASGQQ